MNTKWLIPVAIAILGIYLYKKSNKINHAISSLQSAQTLEELNNLITAYVNTNLSTEETIKLNQAYERIAKEKGWV